MGPLRGQDGCKKDLEAYGFAHSQYEPIWSHVNHFQIEVQDSSDSSYSSPRLAVGELTVFRLS